MSRDKREIQQVYYQGPLPPPNALEKYENILPGSAERILRMAEAQAIHRQKQEEKIVNTTTFTQKLGIGFGFSIAMSGILGGIFLIISGFDVGGLVAILGTLTALTGIFIYSRNKESN